MTLGPISSNSIGFQVSASPLLKPILTAEMKNSLASLHPSSSFPEIYIVLISPKSPALSTHLSKTYMIYSYYSILNLRLIAIPEINTFRYGNQISESILATNFKNDYLCLKIPNSSGVKMFVLRHFSVTSFIW